VAYNTGMRLEEFLSLKWSQVYIYDPPLKVLGLEDVFNYGYIRLYNTKSGQDREIPLNLTLWECLQTLPKGDENDSVLKSSRGGRFKSITDQFKNALRRAGLATARIHDLRGSWAMRMIEKNNDVYSIMRIGGWSTLSSFQRYLRRNQRNLILAMQTLDSTKFVTPYCHQNENKTEKRKTKVA